VSLDNLLQLVFTVAAALLAAKAQHNGPTPITLRSYYVPVQICSCEHVTFARLRQLDGRWLHQAPVFLFTKNTPETHAYDAQLVVKVGDTEQAHSVRVGPSGMEVDGTIVAAWPLEGFRPNSDSRFTSMRLPAPAKLKVGHAWEPMTCGL
jgi:hypothetical protein